MSINVSISKETTCIRVQTLPADPVQQAGIIYPETTAANNSSDTIDLNLTDSDGDDGPDLPQPAAELSVKSSVVLLLLAAAIVFACVEILHPPKALAHLPGFAGEAYFFSVFSLFGLGMLLAGLLIRNRFALLGSVRTANKAVIVLASLVALLKILIHLFAA